jgi:tRNA-dihydrouridine synthase 1
MASNDAQNGVTASAAPKKLQGRQFYESIGSPKYIVAPMVDRSEFVSAALFQSDMPLVY